MKVRTSKIFEVRLKKKKLGNLPRRNTFITVFFTLSKEETGLLPDLPSFCYRVHFVLSKKITKQHLGGWDRSSQTWTHMVLHLTHSEGGFGVTLNVVT